MEAGAMGLEDRRDFMDMYRKEIGGMKALFQRKTTAYYEYNMEVYWDYIIKNDPASRK